MTRLASSLAHEEARSEIRARDASARFILSTIVAAFLLVAQGCIWTEGLWYEDDDLPGEYAVQAVDEPVNAMIVAKKGGSSYCVVPSRVSAYGWNDDFIIARRHPRSADDFRRIDTSTTHWYLIEVAAKTVHGPLSEDAFNKLRMELKVPPELSLTKMVPTGYNRDSHLF